MIAKLRSFRLLNKFSLSTPKEVNKEQYGEYARKRILMLEC